MQSRVRRAFREPKSPQLFLLAFLAFLFAGLPLCASPAMGAGHRTTSELFCLSSAPRGIAVKCEVVVRDREAASLTPEGNVQLTVTSGPVREISPSTCPLHELISELGPIPGIAVCKFTVTPRLENENRFLIRLASKYASQGAHEESSAAETIIVNGATHTSLNCGSSKLVVNHITECRATVEAPPEESPGMGLVELTSSQKAAFPNREQCGIPQRTTRTVTCSIEIKPLMSGHPVLTATYSGGPGSERSEASATFEAMRETQASVSCPRTQPGAEGNCVVTVEDPFGGPAAEARPTGTVNLSSSNGSVFSPASCVLAPVGGVENKASCQVSFTPGTAGDATISASYGGDAQHLTSQGSTLLEVHRQTTTQLVCDASNAIVGDQIACKATVTDFSPSPINPGGQVHFSTENQGTFPTGESCSLTPAAEPNDASCTVQYTAVSIKNGKQHKITAHYEGGAGVDPSEGSAQFEVHDGTETHLLCAPPTVIAGLAATCEVIVVDSAHEPRPLTGSVTLSHDGAGNFSDLSNCQQLEEEAVGRSICSVTYTPEPSAAAVGPQSLSAEYGGDPEHKGSRGTTSITVTARATATSVTCAPLAVAPGESTECTASVEDRLDQGIRPAGTVRFTVDGASADFPGGAECTLPAAGANRCSVAFQPPSAPPSGEATVQGEYAGEPLHGSSSGTFSVKVGRHATKTEIACQPGKILVNHLVTCTAKIADTTSPGGRPGGFVRFSSDSPSKSFQPRGGECTLPATGADECSVEYRPEAVQANGEDAIKAEYAGTAGDSASNATTTVEVVEKTGTSLAIHCNASAFLNGASTSCTGTVTDLGGAGVPATNPTGTIGFSDPADPQAFGSGTCELQPKGSSRATCGAEVTYAPQGIGKHTFTAEYTGDNVHFSSQAERTIGVLATKHDTQTSVTCGPVAVGHRTSCEAVVDDPSAEPAAPGETVSIDGEGTFPNGNACTLSPILEGGKESESESACSVPFAPSGGVPGVRRVSAAYGGGPGHLGSQGTGIALVGPVHPTKTSLACSPSPIAVGQAATCTATVEDRHAGEAATPEGEFTFAVEGEGSVTPEGCEVIASGDGRSAKSCQIEFVPAQNGTPKIVATFHEDAVHATSVGRFQLVVGGEKLDTETALSCGGPQVKFERPTVCTATVKDSAAGGAVPIGDVSFADSAGGSLEPSECELEANGDLISCSITFVASTLGTHHVSAHYLGSGAHNPSAGLADEAVTDLDPTSTTISCGRPRRILGETAQCTATVSDQPRQTLPTGTVEFTSSVPDGFQANTCSLHEVSSFASRCTLPYKPTAIGSPEITASYLGDGGRERSEGSLTLKVIAQPDQTETKVECSPETVSQSAPSHCLATVTDVAGEPSVPGGSVEFRATGAGAFVPRASCALGDPAGERSASCEVAFSSAQLGRHEVVASYEGDGPHEQSSSTPFGLSVVTPPPGKDATATKINCEPNPIQSATATHCTVKVEDSAANPLSPPSGEVVFLKDSQGSFSAPSCELAADGQGHLSCTVDYTPAAGSSTVHHLGAEYKGDDRHEGSIAPFALNVGTPTSGGDATSTEVECSSPAIVGHLTNCTAKVRDEAASPSQPVGTVHFTSDNANSSFVNPICTLSPGGNGNNASCTVQYSPHALPQSGNGDGIEASYHAADGAHEDSTSQPFSLAVQSPSLSNHTTATALACEPVHVVLGGGSACTVTVEDKAGANATTPSGEVAFTDGAGGTVETACKLHPAGGPKASCEAVYVAAVAGKRNVKAIYGGDDSHESSEDEATIEVAQLNGGHTAETALSCEPNPATIGGATVCTVTVTDGAGGAAPSGVVVFASDSAGSFANGGCLLFPAGNGQARCQIVYRPTSVGDGSHRITALYPGDGAHEPAIASTQLGIAFPPGGDQTSTTLKCAPAAVIPGASSECTATVADTTATPKTPGGAVVFGSDSPGSFSKGGCVLQGTGASASCHVAYTPSVTAPGSQTITAVYVQDAEHEPSTASASVSVKALTVTAVACAPSSILIGVGAGTTCTATVTPTAQGAAPATGPVRFSSDGAGGFSSAAACTLAKADGGKATCQVTYTPTALGSGVHKITASYQGDNGDEPSHGEATVEVLDAPNTSFAKKPKLPRRKTTVRVVRIGFVSDHPGSTFECKLDRGAFRPCASPFKAKVRPGAHVFQVRAVSTHHVVDPSPAVFRWKVLGPDKHAKHGAKKKSMR